MTRSSDSDAPANEAGLDAASALITASARFARQATRIAEPQRSVIAWRVLATLHRDGPQRVGDLAVRERISQPTMTGVVKRLTDDGLLARSADPDDGRASLVDVTAHGAAELGLFRRRSAGRLLPALGRLDAAERDTLLAATALLDRLADALGEPAPEPPRSAEPTRGGEQSTP
ncbi:MarR family winged helix-turn-helix transcriptional regulator [Mycetocola reblochoni]|nr:MarR family transcriptional regulator [Mycetocola reblochoni]RLP71085.1 MarR family transcriptional regulator [Mycetocola reblochoni]